MTEISLYIEYSKSGFGFGLARYDHGGYNICNIVPGSPAERAGLMDGDALVAVDDRDMTKMKFEKAVKKIQKSKKTIRMKILRTLLEPAQETDNAEEIEENFQEIIKEAEEDLCQAPPQTPSEECEEKTLLQNDECQETLPNINNARICEITLHGSSYGFTLVKITEESQHTIINVVKDSPAVNAGIKEDDILIQINTINVENMDHDKVVSILRDSGEKVALLVVDQAAYDYFTANGITISSYMDGIEHLGNSGTLQSDEESIKKLEKEVTFLEEASDTEKCKTGPSQSFEEISIPVPISYKHLPLDILQIREILDEKRESTAKIPECHNTSNLVRTISLM